MVSISMKCSVSQGPWVPLALLGHPPPRGNALCPSSLCLCAPWPGISLGHWLSNLIRSCRRRLMMAENLTCCHSKISGVSRVLADALRAAERPRRQELWYSCLWSRSTLPLDHVGGWWPNPPCLSQWTWNLITATATEEPYCAQPCSRNWESREEEEQPLSPWS